MRTRAYFKALRESVGLTQADIADLAGVDRETARRWESGNSDYQMPQAVQRYLERLLEEQRAAVAAALADPPGSVRLWRSPDDRDRHTDADGMCATDNATAREIWLALGDAGRDVEPRYSVEKPRRRMDGVTVERVEGHALLELYRVRCMADGLDFPLVFAVENQRVMYPYDWQVPYDSYDIDLGSVPDFDWISMDEYDRDDLGDIDRRVMRAVCTVLDVDMPEWL